MSLKSINPIQYFQYDSVRSTKRNADIIVETPVSLTVNGEHWLSFMCTPNDLEELAVGFLFNEGVIEHIDEVEYARVCKHGDNVDVWLSHSAEKPEVWLRTSGCTGGVTSVEPDRHDNKFNLENGAVVSPEQIHSLIAKLFTSQELYRKSGGVHTSALSDGDRIIVVAEDIGRHNTLDKIAGRCLMEGISVPRRVMLTTGRISSEMLQKSARLNAAIVISRTSPSSLSISLAKIWGITLIGYARRSGFRVYSHHERILSPESIEVR